MHEQTILYIGGFQLPDKNAAALRVLSNGKILRELGYRVIFVNALIDSGRTQATLVNYEGFECIEYKRETQGKYLFSGRRVRSFIEEFKADCVIAYNYPAVALNSIRSFCKRKGIKCYADATEWYVPTGNIVFKIVKGFDSELRMRYVHPRLEGVIAISDYLYCYYSARVKTIKIPPLVDLNEDKWSAEAVKNWLEETDESMLSLIYAGTPSAQKERLDIIIDAVERAAEKRQIFLHVIGITKEQFEAMYHQKYVGSHVRFWGRVPNRQVIQMTKEADWTIMLREKNKVVQAGFPTKVSETIACGTPVIANKFSNIEEYLSRENSILIDRTTDFTPDFLDKIEKKKENMQRGIFDYHNFLEDFRKFM